MAIQAGASVAYDAGQRGANGTQQLLSGVARGTAEYFAEKISFKGIEILLKYSGGSTAKEIAKGTVKQVATEFGEESATELANIITDSFTKHFASSIPADCGCACSIYSPRPCKRNRTTGADRTIGDVFQSYGESRNPKF